MRKKIISLILVAGCMTGFAMADELKMQENAPDRYVVVKHDTLWDISGRFLKQPWRWPEIWNLNKEQIKNPHWIYPGDVIVLDRSSGKPQLRLLTSETVKNSAIVGNRMSPSIRAEPINRGEAIAAVPPYAIEPFLKRPVVIEPEEFAKAPRIAAGPDERVIFSAMDRVYAVGIDAQTKEGDVWYVYRSGKALIDPDDQEGKKIIGYEAHYVGDVRVDVVDKVSTLRVLTNKQELEIGDRLIRAADTGLINFTPRLPFAPIDGKIVASYDGVADAGTFTTVVINRGSNHFIDVGNVLFSYKQGRPIKKEKREDPDLFTPQVKSANIFVYRVFPTVSYGLILDATLPVARGDEVKVTEQDISPAR